MVYQFPFGEEVKRLEQEDKTPKEIFVLGVYASAVHAKWVKDDHVVCQALAVASEPCIFWDGNAQQAQEIIDKIKIPSEVGWLVLPNSNLNGPSAKVLDEDILKPLGITRNEAWLCDLLPESRINPNQDKVIREKYNPLIKRYGLNEVTIPLEDGKFCDEKRRGELVDEIVASHAETLVLLGDMPIKQFLRYVCKIDFKDLREYTNTNGYGTMKMIEMGGLQINLLPMAHPRQIGGLGSSSQFWFEQHKKWKESQRNI